VPDPVETIVQRLYLARLELNRRERRDVEDVEFGQRVATAMQRPAPWSPATVSLWGAGKQRISIEQAAAMAAVCGVRAGWLAFGEEPMRPTPDADDVPAPVMPAERVSATPAAAARPRKAGGRGR
jgi:hypothetical protein